MGRGEGRDLGVGLLIPPPQSAWSCLCQQLGAQACPLRPPPKPQGPVRSFVPPCLMGRKLQGCSRPGPGLPQSHTGVLWICQVPQPRHLLPEAAQAPPVCISSTYLAQGSDSQKWSSLCHSAKGSRSRGGFQGLKTGSWPGGCRGGGAGTMKGLALPVPDRAQHACPGLWCPRGNAHSPAGQGAWPVSSPQVPAGSSLALLPSRPLAGLEAVRCLGPEIVDRHGFHTCAS